MDACRLGLEGIVSMRLDAPRLGGVFRFLRPNAKPASVNWRAPCLLSKLQQARNVHVKFRPWRG